MPTSLPVDVIKIGPYDFTLLPMPGEMADRNGAAGCTDILDFTILIDVRRKPRYIVDTLLHEITHAIWFVWNIQDRDDEERTVTAIGTGLATVWRDNPEVFKWIAKRVA